MRVTVKQEVEVDVIYLQASCGVRYWEDASVDDVTDEMGDLIPCRVGDRWEPLIAVDTGIIRNWTPGKTADIHYKVCDEGTYTLLDGNMGCVKKVSGYVPSIMSPAENGYGDYVIMNVMQPGRSRIGARTFAAFSMMKPNRLQIQEGRRMTATKAAFKIPTVLKLPTPELRAHQQPCKNCPSAHAKPDPEALDMLAQPHAVRVDHAFLCAWGNRRFCKGYCDVAGVSDADLGVLGASICLADH